MIGNIKLKEIFVEDIQVPKAKYIIAFFNDQEILILPNFDDGIPINFLWEEFLDKEEIKVDIPLYHRSSQPYSYECFLIRELRGVLVDGKNN